MHSHFRQWLVVLLLSLLSLSAHATRYEITTTEDPDPADPSECSIRNAIVAINTKQDEGACEAGTGNDRLELEPGETYVLTRELQIGGEQDKDGDAVNPTVRFVLTDDNEEGENNAVIDLGGSDRAFTIKGDAQLVLAGITVTNGNAAGGNGGLVNVEANGSIQLSGKSRLTGGSAANGGLIYAVSGLVDIREESWLENGNASGAGGALYLAGESLLQINGSALSGNHSDGNGGAVALERAGVPFVGNLAMTNAYIGENTAGGHGGALSMDGDQVNLAAVNTTFAGNKSGAGAGAIHFPAPITSQGLLFNNVTIANNTSAGASGSFYMESGDSEDVIVNSVVVGDLDNNGNVGNGDCAPNSALNDADNDTVFLGWNVLGSRCTDGDTTNTDATDGGQDSIQVLANKNGVCSGGGSCDPADLDPFPGYLPAPDIGAGTVVAREKGRSVTAANNACQSQDQRGVSRLEEANCDAGAIEFETAVGNVDEFDIAWGESVLVDVVENDLGDSRVDCNRLADPGDCVELVIPPERPGASVSFETGAAGDYPDGYPRALYNPGERYHGLDRFAYRIHRDAFDATWQGRDVEAEVNIVAEPEQGLQEDDSIDQLGGLSGLWLMVLAMAGFSRRRMLPGLLVALLAPLAQAAEIKVTSLADNDINGDGVCTLREAINSSRDNAVNPEPACADGQDGSDTIVLPRGCITLDPGEGPLLVQDLITIRGEGAHGVDAAQGLSGAECDPNDDANADWTEGTIIRASDSAGSAGMRIIDAENSLRLEDMSLMYGDATLDGGALRTGSGLTLQRVEFYANRTSANGGAIYLVGNPDPADPQEVIIHDSYFLENIAGGDGGALSMAATYHDQEILDSTFEGNQAGNTGSGGAIKFAMINGGAWLTNITVTNNEAGDGAGGMDLREVVRNSTGSGSGTPTVVIGNSTIFGNTNAGGGPGGLDLGEEQIIDSRSARDIRLNNSILGGNSDNRCSAAATPQPFDELMFNLLSDSDAGSCMGGAEQDNDRESDTAISDALITPAASNVASNEQDFVPPSLAVQEGQGAAARILNSGNDDSLASGAAGNSRECRAEDVRGLPRTSGGRCDRGAFEFQETTAQDDRANISRQRDGRVLIDVLSNDSTDPQRFSIDPTSIVATPQPLPSGDLPGVVPVYRAFPDVKCGDQAGLQEAREDNPDVEFDEDNFECVVLYDPAHEFPLDENSPRNDIDCEPPDSDLPLEFTDDNLGAAFSYTYEAVDDDDPNNTDLSPSADVFFVITNEAPRISSQSILNQQGETRVIRLEAEDNFGGSLEWDSLELDQKPSFAARDDNGDVEGVGIKLNEPFEGYITYVPGDITKTFTDRFSLKISDSCGEESKAATIEIRYPQEDVAGGELLSGGVAGLWSLLGLLGLGGLRRRLRAPAPRRR